MTTLPPTTRVGAVVRPSPAYDAGLRPGDRLAAIEGTRIDSWAQVAPIIQPAVGRSLRIVVVGPDGQRRTISVTSTNGSMPALCVTLST